MPVERFPDFNFLYLSPEFSALCSKKPANDRRHRL